MYLFLLPKVLINNFAEHQIDKKILSQDTKLYGEMYGKNNDAKRLLMAKGINEKSFIQINIYTEMSICEIVENLSGVIFQMFCEQLYQLLSTFVNILI